MPDCWVRVQYLEVNALVESRRHITGTFGRRGPECIQSNPIQSDSLSNRVFYSPLQLWPPQRPASSARALATQTQTQIWVNIKYVCANKRRESASSSQRRQQLTLNRIMWTLHVSLQYFSAGVGLAPTADFRVPFAYARGEQKRGMKCAVRTSVRVDKTARYTLHVRRAKSGHRAPDILVRLPRTRLLLPHSLPFTESLLAALYKRVQSTRLVCTGCTLYKWY